MNRGFSQAQINSIRTKMWLEGRTKDDSCMICFEKFSTGAKYKELKCGHEYDAECIDKWLLERGSTCPICKFNVKKDYNVTSAEQMSNARTDDPAANIDEWLSRNY